MNTQEQKYRETMRKALDFGKSFNELTNENKRRLVYEVTEATGTLGLLKEFLRFLQKSKGWK